MSQLNPKQREACHYISGPLLVLAGAGSGKTSVITRKMVYLVEQCGIKARHIAALTFTNKAAREMKERVGKMLKGTAARGLTVSTFHNLGLHIIRQELTTLGFKEGFSIFDAEDARVLIRDLMLKDFEEAPEEAKDIQMVISNWKNAMCTPDQAISRAQDNHELMVAHIYQRYNRALRAYNAVDFDDLILLPVTLFQTHPPILEKWQKKIRYLLVDEYQDTNITQYALVKLLVGDFGKFTVVGDDDQSIYAWRGARPENLIQLKEDFRSLKVIKLEQNYRSTARILRTANHLIDYNPHVFEKTLWSDFGLGDPIRVIETRNEEAECERIASEILDMRLRKRAQFKDFAVLYRGNHQSRLLELKLQSYQIPYRMSGGQSFFSRTEIKDAMGYLRLLINPDDDAAFLRVVNVPRREIGTSTLEKLGTYSNQSQQSLNAAAQNPGLAEGLSGRGLQRVQQFSQWLDKTRSRCKELDAIRAIKQLFTDIEYEEWLAKNANTPRQAEKQMSNVWALVDSLQQLLDADKGTADKMSLEDGITRLVLRDMLEQQDEDEELDKVHLLTLHASKGLEFPHVFIMGMEEEILPHRSSIEEGNIEEERRLMYVGITRARQSLTLTYAGQRKQYGEKIETIPSRFIDEMPEEDLAQETLFGKDPVQNHERGLETLSAILGDLKNSP